MKGFFQLPSRKDLARTAKIAFCIGLLFSVPRIALLVGIVPPYWLAAGPSMSGSPIVKLEKVTPQNPITVADERSILLFRRPGFLGIPTYSIKRLLVFQDTRTKIESSSERKLLADDSHCWFAGDNEDVSKDSRSEGIGWVPTRQVLARVTGGFPPLRKEIPSFPAHVYPSVPPPDEEWVKKEVKNRIGIEEQLMGKRKRIYLATIAHSDPLGGELSIQECVFPRIRVGKICYLSNNELGLRDIKIHVRSIKLEPRYTTRHEVTVISHLEFSCSSSQFRDNWLLKRDDSLLRTRYADQISILVR